MSTQYATAAEFRSFGIAAAAIAQYSDAQLDVHLKNASTWADGYLRSFYSLPLSSWSNDLKLAVCQYAKFLILDYRGTDPSDPAAVTMQMALKQAEKFWEDVNAGRRTLQVVDTKGSARVGPVVTSTAKRGW